VSAPKVGLQLYTVRAASLPLERLLQHVAGAGYDGVETVATQGVEPEQLRDALQQSRLAIASAHVPLHALRQDLDAVVRSHTTVGTPLLVVPYLDERERPGDASGWRAFGQELGTIGARLRDEGLALAYHHHDFELAGPIGEEPLRHLLDAAEADDLALELDTGWLLREGRSPVDWLDAYGRRVTRLHVKDLRAGATPPWVDVGDGELDLGALVGAAREHAVPWMLVEHDHPSDPLETMRRSASALLAALGR
jgi:sugar phosphate isomerase/epimerase